MPPAASCEKRYHFRIAQRIFNFALIFFFLIYVLLVSISITDANLSLRRDFMYIMYHPT